MRRCINAHILVKEWCALFTLSFGVLQQRCTHCCTMPHRRVSPKFPYVEQETNSFPIVLSRQNASSVVTRKRRFTRTCPGNTFLRARARERRWNLQRCKCSGDGITWKNIYKLEYACESSSRCVARRQDKKNTSIHRVPVERTFYLRASIIRASRDLALTTTWIFFAPLFLYPSFIHRHARA